jgi:hypothetical protein
VRGQDPSSIPDMAIRPGTMRLPQKEFVDHLQRQFAISKFTAFARLRALESKALLQVDRTAGPRKTKVILDISAIADRFSDEIGCEGQNPTVTPLGPLTGDGTPLAQRLINARIIDLRKLRDPENREPVTDEFLARCLRTEEDMEQKYPGMGDAAHMRALTQLFAEKLGPMTPNEFLNLLLFCELVGFASRYVVYELNWEYIKTIVKDPPT